MAGAMDVVIRADRGFRDGLVQRILMEHVIIAPGADSRWYAMTSSKKKRDLIYIVDSYFMNNQLVTRCICNVPISSLQTLAAKIKCSLQF